MILDEVHRTPGLFPILRGIIDGARREGQRSGLYLLLGSAALELLRQSGETLAGRVSFMELAPFDVTQGESQWSVYDMSRVAALQKESGLLVVSTSALCPLLFSIFLETNAPKRYQRR